MELHTLEVDDDIVVIYRPLRRLAFVGNRALARVARAVATEAYGTEAPADSPALTFLREVGFLDPDPYLPPADSATFQPTTAVLLLTNRCQLRCSYCYARGGEGVAQDLTPDLACAAIDTVCRHAIAVGRPDFELAFHGGGEPSLAWGTLQAATRYARERPLPCRISLVSNGVWSPSKRDWLIANLDSFSISIDGGPLTQDRQRPMAGGGGSFARVAETLAALDQVGVDYGIRMTAIAPWGEQLVADVQALCETTRCHYIQVEPAFNTLRGSHRSPERSEWQAFRDGFVAAHAIARAAERTLVYAGARPWLLAAAFCAAPYDALIVTPDGVLVTCYEVAGSDHPLRAATAIGTLRDGAIYIDLVARDDLHRRLAERRMSCRDCLCFHSCAGGCIPRMWGGGPTGHMHVDARCELNRALTLDLLLDKIMAGGGVWDGGGEG